MNRDPVSLVGEFGLYSEGIEELERDLGQEGNVAAIWRKNWEPKG